MRTNSACSSMRRNVHEERIVRAVIERRTRVGEYVAFAREIPLDNFRARVDLAFFRSRIEFFEIKSAADSLARLTHQVSIFARMCDKLHLVVASRHLPRVLDESPEGVEIWESANDGSITVVRRGIEQKITDPDVLLSLVTAKELRHCLCRMGLPAGRASRRQMDIVAVKLPTSTLRTIAMYSLRRRYMRSRDLLTLPELPSIGATRRNRLSSEIAALRPIDRFVMNTGLFGELPVLT